MIKFGWLILLTILVFAYPELWFVLVLFTATLIFFKLIKFPLGQIRGLWLFLSTALLLGLLQIIFNHHGNVIAQLGPISFTDLGITYGAYVSFRFLCIIFLSYLFVITTSPNDLAYALMQVGLPYRFGFALVTALRFVPIFEKEAQTIYQAQLMRGVRYDRRNITRLLTLARQFTLPVLVSALRKVDSLAISMEGRSFGRYSKRSYFRPIQFSTNDWLSVGILVVFVFLIFII